jgi:SET domain-containing protein
MINGREYRPVRYVVRPSPIHGFGVFATAPLDANEPIGMMVCQPYPLDAGADTMTSVITSRHRCAVIGGFPMWYVNYSEFPNCRVLTVTHDDMTPAIVTNRAIDAGEELTLPFVR